MAYSKQALTAIYPFGAGGPSMAALYAANTPFVVAHNCLRDASRIQWRYSEEWFTGIDQTLAGAPTSRLCDGFTHLQTLPDAAGGDRHALLIEWPDDALASFDFICIAGHNILDQSFEVEVDTDVDDASTFGTAETVEGTVQTIHGKRIAVSLAERFTGVKYARLILDGGTGADWVPALGEMIIGKRCCLPRFPDEPWDPTAFRTSQTRQATNAGVESRVIYSTKQRIIEAAVTTKDSLEAAEINRIYTESNGCSRPVLWCDKPGSTWRYNLLNIDEDEWRSPYVGPTEREFRIVGSEQGPLFHEGEV